MRIAYKQVLKIYDDGNKIHRDKRIDGCTIHLHQIKDSSNLLKTKIINKNLFSQKDGRQRRNAGQNRNWILKKIVEKSHILYNITSNCKRANIESYSSTDLE